MLETKASSFLKKRLEKRAARNIVSDADKRTVFKFTSKKQGREEVI
jgi:hypothetical protein